MQNFFQTKEQLNYSFLQQQRVQMKSRRTAAEALSNSTHVRNPAHVLQQLKQMHCKTQASVHYVKDTTMLNTILFSSVLRKRVTITLFLLS